VGYSGITQAKQIDPAFQAQLARVPRLAEREMGSSQNSENKAR